MIAKLLVDFQIPIRLFGTLYQNYIAADIITDNMVFVHQWGTSAGFELTFGGYGDRLQKDSNHSSNLFPLLHSKPE